MTCVNGLHSGSVLGFLNCFIPLKIHSYQTSTYLLFVYAYLAISIPGFKLNSKHTFSRVCIIVWGIFILITLSTRSYQVPTSQLDNSMHCLCTHFACTYIAISAFSRAFIIACRCFYTANFFYQLCIWLYFPVN